MKIITNNYMNTANKLPNETLPKKQDKNKTEAETKPAANTDTFTMSIGDKQFTARKKESDSAMFTAEIVSDLDEFRSAINCWSFCPCTSQSKKQTKGGKCKGLRLLLPQ